MRNDLGIAAVTRRVSGAGDVSRRRLVAKGPGANEVAYPAGANATGLEGVTLDDAKAGKGAPVQLEGFAEIEIAAPVGANVEVKAADAMGRIGVVGGEAAGTTFELAGVTTQAGSAAGSVVMVDIRRLGESRTV
jgi:hypothetical protein